METRPRASTQRLYRNPTVFIVIQRVYGNPTALSQPNDPVLSRRLYFKVVITRLTASVRVQVEEEGDETSSDEETVSGDEDEDEGPWMEPSLSLIHI